MLNIVLGCVSLFLCFLSIAFSLFKFDRGLLALLGKREAALVLVSVVMTVQGVVSLFSGFVAQGLIGLSFSAGNFVKAIELEEERAGGGAF